MMPTEYDAAIRTALHRTLELERLRNHAACLGLDRARADALLAQAQGDEASSTPTDEDFAAARQLLWGEFDATTPPPDGDPFARLAGL
ncbi:hypothetical protein [Kitasatospora sp. NPDC006786]|uniref:hypothetical protein n=1 Tax=unclassified Kitasatospora TaxID=2633591 RepID=UPI0033CD399C